MTQERNDTKGREPPIQPLGPGEARVWLELGEGGDPVAALEAAQADYRARQDDVQGYYSHTHNYQVAGPGGKVETWSSTYDAKGNLIGRTLLPPQPHVILSLGPGGEIVERTVYY